MAVLDHNDNHVSWLAHRDHALSESHLRVLRGAMLTLAGIVTVVTPLVLWSVEQASASPPSLPRPLNRGSGFAQWRAVLQLVFLQTSASSGRRRREKRGEGAGH